MGHCPIHELLNKVRLIFNFTVEFLLLTMGWKTIGGAVAGLQCEDCQSSHFVWGMWRGWGGWALTPVITRRRWDRVRKNKEKSESHRGQKGQCAEARRSQKKEDIATGSRKHLKNNRGDTFSRIEEK